MPTSDEIKSKVVDHQWDKKSLLRLINHLMNAWKTVRIVLNGESAHKIIMVIATRSR